MASRFSRCVHHTRPAFMPGSSALRNGHQPVQPCLGSDAHARLGLDVLDAVAAPAVEGGAAETGSNAAFVAREHGLASSGIRALS